MKERNPGRYSRNGRSVPKIRIGMGIVIGTEEILLLLGTAVPRTTLGTNATEKLTLGSLIN